MDNQRLFLWLGLLIVLWLTWRTWMEDYAAPAPPTPPTQTQEQPAAEAPPNDGFDLPELTPGTDPAQVVDPEEAREARGGTIRVVTDVLDVEIELDGGNLVRAELPEYPIQKDRPDLPVRLLSSAPGELFVLQTGLRALGELPEPNHFARFEAAQSEYVLQPGQDRLDVELVWRDESGVTARKIYSFARGWYRIDVAQELLNDSAEPWSGASYVRLQRRHQPRGRSLFDVESFSFTGPVLYDGRSYDKLSVDDLQRAQMQQTLFNGWLASVQHHFLAAAVPPPDQEISYTAQARDGIYQLTAVGPVTQIAPGQSERFEQRLFVGPKLQSQLRETGDRLQLTVDYGVLTLLAQPLFWLMDRVHDFVGNWGWSIVLVTILIKLVFWKLTAASGRSMAKMRKLQPRMKALQERYAEDRQAMSRAMMDLYRREKVNPAAGCLPILIQLPFFLAFYWVLLESVEMRQAPFMLWINDLSSRDPFFVLPVLMGLTMWLQTRLNPAPPDPVQAKIMQFLPVIFTVFFAIFPAGLVLYWFTNTLLSVGQQWHINRSMEAVEKPA